LFDNLHYVLVYLAIKSVEKIKREVDTVFPKPDKVVEMFFFLHFVSGKMFRIL